MHEIYESTRDHARKISGKQAIIEGISPDGGLYVWPGLADVSLDLSVICKQSYQENAVYILRHLLPDYTEEELKTCVRNAYGDSFSSSGCHPVTKSG